MPYPYLQRAIDQMAPQTALDLLGAMIEGRNEIAARIRQCQQHDREGGMSEAEIKRNYTRDENALVMISNIIERLEADIAVQQGRQAA